MVASNPSGLASNDFTGIEPTDGGSNPNGDVLASITLYVNPIAWSPRR